MLEMRRAAGYRRIVVSPYYGGDMANLALSCINGLPRSRKGFVNRRIVVLTMLFSEQSIEFDRR